MRLVAVLCLLLISTSAWAAKQTGLPATSCNEARALVVSKAGSGLITQEAKTWSGTQLKISGASDSVALGSFVGAIELGYSGNEGASILVCAFDLVEGSKWSSLARVDQLRTAGESKLRVPFGAAAKHPQRAKFASADGANERMIFVWQQPASTLLLKPSNLQSTGKKVNR